MPIQLDASIRRRFEIIRQCNRQMLSSAIEIGKQLQEIKGSPNLRHGQWLPALRQELDWNDRTARSYMRVAEILGPTIENISENSNRSRGTDLAFSLNVMRKLAERETPPQLREEMVERAARGERVTVRQINHRIQVDRNNLGPPRLAGVAGVRQWGPGTDNPEPQISRAEINVSVLASALERALSTWLAEDLSDDISDEYIDRLDTALTAVVRAFEAAKRRRRRGNMRVIQGGTNE
jgi:Protein of unknown function (DUF3102)